MTEKRKNEHHHRLFNTSENIRKVAIDPGIVALTRQTEQHRIIFTTPETNMDCNVRVSANCFAEFSIDNRSLPAKDLSLTTTEFI